MRGHKGGARYILGDNISVYKTALFVLRDVCFWFVFPRKNQHLHFQPQSAHIQLYETLLSKLQSMVFFSLLSIIVYMRYGLPKKKETQHKKVQVETLIIYFLIERGWLVKPWNVNRY